MRAGGRSAGVESRPDLEEGVRVRFSDVATVAQLDLFDEVIDVRSPSEFADDHAPGATSFPVLSDAERAEVGTIHKEQSAFAAKKRGAVLAARNIADHIDRELQHRPPGWRPLVYCWRGGKRSRSLAIVLREIGWPAATLEGGYKAYRRHVLGALEALPCQLSYIVVCGETGSGKSRILESLAQRGEQVLDLEALAAHRGSVLGEIPGAPQPSQKTFETLLWDRLRRFERDRPVFVESESKKIGALQVPEALLSTMRASPCVRIDASREARVRFLLAEYAHFLGNRPALHARLEMLMPLFGREVTGRWKAAADAGEWAIFVTDLLESHYDPAYRRSMSRNFARLAQAQVVATDDLSPVGIDAIARTIASLPTEQAPA